MFLIDRACGNSGNGGASVARWLPTCLLLLAWLAPSVSLAATSPWRIVIIYSFGRDFAPHDTVGAEFRSELTRRASRPVEFYEVSLDTARLAEPDPAGDDALADYLIAKFADSPPDLVVTLGAPAARFVLNNRGRMLAATPLLMGGVEPRLLGATTLSRMDAAVTAGFDQPTVLKTILALRPETRSVVVILGASAHERGWRELSQQDFKPFAERIHFTYTSDLSLEQMRHLVATLPADASILYHRVAVDATGIPYEQDDVLQQLHEVASVPIFGMFDRQLGKGIVGGPLMSLGKVGHAVTDYALRILEGESPDALPTTDSASFAYQFDWRELERWKIPESRLPAGSVVRFKPESLWRQNREVVGATVALIVLQGVFILALALQFTRRRRAEREARELNIRLLSAHEDEKRRLARDLHDDFSHRIARLSIEAAQLERADSPREEPRILHNIRQELTRLSEDMHSISHQLHPSVLEDLGLVEALRTESDHVARSAALGVTVQVGGEVPDPLPVDVALCAFRVAQEALRNVTRHARANNVNISVRAANSHLSLSVSDDGVGFDPEADLRTPGIGHASMRERVRLVGGTLAIRSAKGRGTTIEATMPLARTA